jgi:hypothetical protein
VRVSTNELERVVKNPRLFRICHVVGVLDESVRKLNGVYINVEIDPSTNETSFVVLTTIGFP